LERGSLPVKAIGFRRAIYQRACPLEQVQLRRCALDVVKDRGSLGM